MSDKEPNLAHIEAQIREIIADQMAAICAKDLERLMKHYDVDAVVFDAEPPFQTVGAYALKQMWEACFPDFPSSFDEDIYEFHFTVSGDLAVAHWRSRFTGMNETDPLVRCTTVFKRNFSSWLITHEHVSAPHVPSPRSGYPYFTTYT